MLTQERANLVLYNMRQRQPDETDSAPATVEYDGAPDPNAGASGHAGEVPTLPLADDDGLVEMEVEVEDGTE